MREAEGQRWLEQAKEDLRWAQLLAREGGYHLACFLAQQVAEKGLMAFLYAQGEEIVTGHSIERLSTAAARYLPEFRARAEHWAILDGYYVPTRYPNSLPASIPARVYNREAAERAVELAAEVVSFVEEHLAEG
ncbi:MAG: HEPN domain-containing protein [Candidatus Acetothermia bacterium]|jgi:HEPN domain-containing protein|nr:HEPN domain-containing protein [Candidatus Acetothermia bacterium]MDH7505848.1 HEPN domain-containing protein [Candidatus Acetothermia bacterium]